MDSVVILRDGRRIPRGRIIEDPDGTLTWETHVRESKHLFRRLDAWTLSDTVLKQLIARGVERIRLRVRETGEIYEVDLTKFAMEAEELDQTGWRSATERQYALPRHKWERKGIGAKQLSLL